MEHLLEKYFKEIASWESSKGGFYIWIKFNEPIVTTDFFMNLLNQKVLINPGYIYEPKDTYHIRLSYSYISDKELIEGLQTLYSEAIKKNREFY